LDQLYYTGALVVELMSYLRGHSLPLFDLSILEPVPTPPVPTPQPQPQPVPRVNYRPYSIKPSPPPAPLAEATQPAGAGAGADIDNEENIEGALLNIEIAFHVPLTNQVNLFERFLGRRISIRQLLLLWSLDLDHYPSFEAALIAIQGPVDDLFSPTQLQEIRQILVAIREVPEFQKTLFLRPHISAAGDFVQIQMVSGQLRATLFDLKTLETSPSSSLEDEIEKAIQKVTEKQLVLGCVVTEFSLSELITKTITTLTTLWGITQTNVTTVWSIEESMDLSLHILYVNMDSFEVVTDKWGQLENLYTGPEGLEAGVVVVRRRSPSLFDGYDVDSSYNILQPSRSPTNVSGYKYSLFGDEDDF
jgi:hypothetical protein